MKRILVLLLTLIMCFSMLAGCSAPAQDAGAVAPEQDSQAKAPEIQQAAPAEEMLKEIEKSLMTQLQPLPEAGKNEKIGVLIISLTNSFWANMKTCYEQAGKDLGITVEVLTGTTEGDTTSQLETLMTMASKDYDAIIVSPIDGTNLIPGIIQCNQNNVKVINLGPGVDTKALEAAGGHLDGKITVMFQDQGRLCAEDMVSRLSGGGKVAILQGLAGAAQSEGRTTGAKAVFDASKGIDLVAVQPCDWDATIAYDATKALIQANPDLKGIFACNDVMALAAVEALKSEGKTDVLVYGVDFTADAKASIESGGMMGSMTYSSAIYTKAAMLYALKLVQGQTVEGPVYSPITLVTQDNVKDFDGWK
ncbi:sugar ABC transporter substrate-binding protein [Lutispora saccharofermentans]|uniref:Substrate-binding domain-containing protein n=1 Tax=Lutispora saccharofermentans TaxID=3024236 RepID=A0ABT1NHI2_9FIRM|nr:substrate-binding domain-containing protein [Lutispora saccharofermentans]MCQ1530698.1 substrate-binding domain-containing protein [Lutispora saccharofermentans]